MSLPERVILLSSPQDYYVAAKVPIETLEISTRTRNTLVQAGIRSAGQLALLTITEIQTVRNIGDTAVEELSRALASYHLSFREVDDLVFTKARRLYRTPGEIPARTLMVYGWQFEGWWEVTQRLNFYTVDEFAHMDPQRFAQETGVSAVLTDTVRSRFRLNLKLLGIHDGTW